MSILASTGGLNGCKGKSANDVSSDPGASDTGGAVTSSATSSAPGARLDDNALAAQYEAAKEQIDAALADPVNGKTRTQVIESLRTVASQAKDLHLRANASVALGLIHERSGDLRSATSFYRQARAAVPNQPEVHAVLALALAQQGDLTAAIEVQEALVRLVPDDLEAWLFLGEINIKAKRDEDAKMAYAAYETRRRGLLDGLTLKAQGQFVKSESDRAQCAHALAPARDSGTALALLYALSSDPSPRVRAAIATTMAEQRLRGYADGVAKQLAKESDPSVIEALNLAKGEIAREPLEASPGPAPQADTTQGNESTRGSTSQAESTSDTAAHSTAK